MKIKEKILKTISVVGVFFSAIFFVLFKQAKEEKIKTEKEKEAAEQKINVLQAVNNKVVEGKKENEELLQKAGSGVDIDSFNASVELLQKQSEKGRKRNSNC